MDKAKAAVSSFLSKDGKHDTHVSETINPAIHQEHVKRAQHEEVQTVVDREVHQDHHHTSVQPIIDKEVLPEQHSHQLGAVQEREFHHGSDDHIKAKLEAERAKFQSTREMGDVHRSTSEVGAVAGEHVHHHVHETIQPVIQKETIQNSVVHTTIPVHEVHHNEAKHHATSALPAVSMSEFKAQGGALGGREVRSDAFAGEPKAVGETLGTKGSHHIGGPGAQGTTTLTDERGIGGTHGTHTGHHTGTHTGEHLTGEHRTGEHRTGEHRTGDHLTGTHHTGTQGVSGSTYNDSTTTGTGNTTTQKKASLMDKLNPMVDSNGDGKAGFMK